MELLLNTIALEPNRWAAGKIPFFSLDALLSSVADAGFDRLEVWHHHATTLDAAALHQTRRRADDLGVACVVLGLYPGFDLTVDDEVRDTWRRWFAAGVHLGVEGVKIFVGDRGSAALDAAARARTLDALGTFVETAAEAGLWVTGETHANTLFDTVASCRDTLAHFPAGRLDVCFQPYDFTDTDRALADYAALRDRVRHLHFQGRRDDRFVHLARADLDYGRLIDAFRTPPAPTFWCIEFVEDCVVADPKAFDLERVLAHARADRAFLLQNVPGR